MRPASGVQNRILDAFRLTEEFRKSYGEYLYELDDNRESIQTAIKYIKRCKHVEDVDKYEYKELIIDLLYTKYVLGLNYYEYFLFDFENVPINERLDYLSGFGDREWDQAYNDAYNHGFTSQAEVLDSRKAQVADDLADVERRLENMKKAKGKSAKKQREALEKQKAKLQSKQAGLEYREGRLKDEAFKQQKISEAQDIFDKTVENLDPADAGYDAAYKEAEEAFKQAEKAWTDKTDAARELAKETTQGKIAAFKDTTSTMGKVMKAWGAINTAKSAVDKYKESRAEGRGVISSGVRAAGSAVAADMLGPIGSIALPFIQAAPGAVIGATDFIMSEQRRMNSSANFMPLGGTSFQDSQQLATMRQSGMELAKMSQYNLEQTLMGAEAKHLHR
jgi:hypothetical protein